MILLFQVIIGLILAVVLYNLIHYFFVTRPTQKRLKISQAIVDQAIKYALQKIMPDESSEQLKSQAIANVWGRGVMAFEYEFPQNIMQLSISEFKQLLIKELHEYSADHHFDASSTPEIQSIFRVTDIWELDGKLHFDVAFLINQTTIEYVEDLNRLK